LKIKVHLSSNIYILNKPKKQFSLKQKLAYSAIIFGFFFLLILLIGEIIVRLTTQPTEYSDKSIMHDELGWMPKANYSSTYKVRNQGKNASTYKVNYATDKYGFREWGDPSTSKPKVWFVGDSFVQSVEVSNENLFYNHIKDSLNIEVFAFGQAGYGILQEKMIVDKYIELIKPDLIVWQTCDNDFVDNHAPLEYNSGYKVGLRRPYLNLDGEIEYRKPVPKWVEIVDKSKFLGLIRKKIKNTFGSKENVSAQQLITDLNKDYPPYAKSIEITNQIVAGIRKTTKNTPVIAFSASRFEPSLANMAEIFKNNNIPYNYKVGRQVFDKNKSGSTLHSSDGYHWNPAGQKYISKLLIPDINNALNSEDF